MKLNEKLKLCLESVEIRNAIAFELIIEDVEKLQEQNKTLKDALELITATKDHNPNNEKLVSYNTIFLRKIAREALAKVDKQLPSSEDTI